jgi:hypothetical protein
MAAIARFEEQVNSNSTGYVRRQDVEGPVTTVALQESEKFQMTKYFGNWWPKDVYEASKGPLPKDKVFLLENRPGIIMEESAGMPIGAVRLDRVHSTGVVKHTALADTANEHLQGQVEHLYDSARKKVLDGISVMYDAEHGGTASLAVQTEKKLKKNHSDSSSEVDFLGLGSLVSVKSLTSTNCAEQKSKTPLKGKKHKLWGVDSAEDKARAGPKAKPTKPRSAHFGSGHGGLCASCQQGPRASETLLAVALKQVVEKPRGENLEAAE